MQRCRLILLIFRYIATDLFLSLTSEFNLITCWMVAETRETQLPTTRREKRITKTL